MNEGSSDPSKHGNQKVRQEQQRATQLRPSAAAKVNKNILRSKPKYESRQARGKILGWEKENEGENVGCKGTSIDLERSQQIPKTGGQFLGTTAPSGSKQVAGAKADGVLGADAKGVQCVARVAGAQVAQ